MLWNSLEGLRRDQTVAHTGCLELLATALAVSAREVMQLFSIGTVMLNEDGSEQLDANNAPIPTYDNEAM